MKIKLIFSPSIIDFPNLYKERQSLEICITKVLNEHHFVNQLPDWTLQFTIILGKGNWNGIYKKGTTTSSLLQRNNSLYISIPFDKQIDWGIPEKKFAPRPELDKNKFNILPATDLNLYKSLNDYIFEESYSAIISLLMSGIKIKNVNIKI
ncbi:hypothetical protein J0383_03560 [Flavobacterium endoglycinae]|uniref:Uncharacterized protein n=1 Tax=Flavobacterium endoglycinae TaxID=2816357 RepID=A0ABX7QFP0_9FLAO|nr:Imm9 family immunity protein [Flavobacterium endoglycinae]QSW89899.1 hypothetical protein J0383_03560 [Flavobacterium endoglycinae]